VTGDPGATLRIVRALTEAQAAELHALFQGEWWTRGRALEDVRRMLAGSGALVALIEPASDRLAAFARALTDGVYKALILDVIVSPHHRGQGLGWRVMEVLHAHPALAGVRHFELYCLPAVAPFYAAWGYTSELGELRLMRREREPVPGAGGRTAARHYGP
jgi:GNAT superfamily N-acetyltransferase